MRFIQVGIGFLFVLYSNLGQAQAKLITENQFKNCIELSNETVRVVLEPNIGGRVLKYELNGQNILYVDPAQNGLTEKPKGMYKGPSAGRFDFGPTRVIPKHDNLWWGKWEGEITGRYSAQLISQVDEATGVQLIRNFELDSIGTKLKITQTILNKSQEKKRYCYWGRTFVKGGGLTIVPLNPGSRYPKKYLAYGDEKEIFFEPKTEDNLVIDSDIFLLRKTSAYKKYVMDGEEGWMAYLSTNNQLFVKTFDINPEKVYAEMSACTMSVWFSDDKIVEIEPMGPWEWIDPGKSSSFVEEWYLIDYENGYSTESILKEIKQFIAK